eukprot:5333991-Pleurochrysis_carterae.AAC.1
MARARVSQSVPVSEKSRVERPLRARAEGVQADTGARAGRHRKGCRQTQGELQVDTGRLAGRHRKACRQTQE